ncbi:MAG TPA: peptidylprolyl isomerase, partial [Candidatus Ozemobacteraceae bacterium]|nr:peptidylprolyl isomerase [Candidatus Ozemobacteraceae bacterium]
IAPADMEKTLCTIGTETIKIGAFLPELERVPPMFRAQLIDDFVGQFCDRELVRRHVQQNIESMTKQYPEAVKAARRRVGVRLLLEENISKKVQVSDEDIKDFYTKNLTQFAKPEEVRAHHILVEKEERAKELLATIEKKEKTFEDVAQADSKCPSGKRGGDLGFFSKGQMVKEFDEAAQSAEIGKVVGPVKTEFGYHLIRVDERKASGTAALDEVKDFIKQQLLPDRQRKALEEYVAELKKAYPVSEHPEKL